MPNPVVHFEIAGKNPAGLQRFYSSLFGWQVNSDNPMHYGLVDTRAGRGINGGIEGEAREPQVTFYVEVDDLPAVLSKIEQAGGATVTPVTEVPGMVTFATFRDPAGNIVGLVKSEPLQVQ